MTHLSVNLNKVALLRNQRDLDLPNLVAAGRVCLEAGADGLTVHPRPDERHVRPSDVPALALLMRETGGERELNVEGNPFAGGFLDLVRDARPTQCTLVPDDPAQRTSDHGWTLAEGETRTADYKRLVPVVDELRALGVRSSLFMDADLVQIEATGALGVDRIELYTEPYAAAFGTPSATRVWEDFRDAAAAAQSHGLGVNAGHDLSLENLARFLEIPGILEVSIGHALTADALFMGLDASVRAYLGIAQGR